MASLRKPLIPVRKVSLKVAPMHSSKALYQASVFLLITLSPFPGESHHDSRLDNHPFSTAYASEEPVHQTPLFYCNQRVNMEPMLGQSLFHWELWFLSEGIGHKRAGVALPQQLTLKSMSTHFCLLAPESCREPVLFKFQWLRFSLHHMIYPIFFHSSIPAWRIPWIEEPGRLQTTELQRVGHS